MAGTQEPTKRWAYLEITLDPATGQVTHVDGKPITNLLAAPPARQIRAQLGSEGWELVSAQPNCWIFKREAVVPQQWEYCCLTEDHSGGIRKGQWVLVYYKADGNHVEHEHRRLGTTIAQLGKSGWQLIGIADPGQDERYDNTSFYFARPAAQTSATQEGSMDKDGEQNLH
jgi:hypothetical protein